MTGRGLTRAGVDYQWIADNLTGQDVGGVEVDDADADDEPIGTVLEDTIHERRLPGDGSFDIPAFLNAIEATGYAGPVGAEIIAAQHRARPVEEAVGAAFEAATRFTDRS